MRRKDRLTNEQRAAILHNRSPEIDAAIARGVARAIEDHRRAGNPIAVWRDGRVVWIPPEEIPPLREDDHCDTVNSALQQSPPPARQT